MTNSTAVTFDGYTFEKPFRDRHLAAHYGAAGPWLVRAINPVGQEVLTVPDGRVLAAYGLPAEGTVFKPGDLVRMSGTSLVVEVRETSECTDPDCVDGPDTFRYSDPGRGDDWVHAAGYELAGRSDHVTTIEEEPMRNETPGGEGGTS